mgnify:CR=1 FL=1
MSPNAMPQSAPTLVTDRLTLAGDLLVRAEHDRGIATSRLTSLTPDNATVALLGRHAHTMQEIDDLIGYGDRVGHAARNYQRYPELLPGWKYDTYRCRWNQGSWLCPCAVGQSGLFAIRSAYQG